MRYHLWDREWTGPKESSMSVTSRLGLLVLYACLAACAANPSAPQGTAQPRVSDTHSIVFDGATFTELFVTRKDGDILREYYLAGETPEKWTRFVELRVYSGTGKGMSAEHFVKDMDRRLKLQDPQAETGMTLSPDGGVGYDFGIRTQADALAGESEFNAFEFSTDRSTGALIGFHYVEKFSGDTDDRDDRNTVQRYTKIEARIKPEIAALPAYQE